MEDKKLLMDISGNIVIEKDILAYCIANGVTNGALWG